MTSVTLIRVLSTATVLVAAATLHEPALAGSGRASRFGQLAGTDLVRLSADVAAGTIAGTGYCAAKGQAAVTGCGPGGCMVKR